MKDIDEIRRELFYDVRVFTLSDAMLGFRDKEHIGLVPMVYAFDESYGPIELSEKMRLLPGEYTWVPEERPQINTFRQNMANNAKLNPHVGYYRRSYEEWENVKVGTIFSTMHGGDYDEPQEYVRLVEKRPTGFEFVALTGRLCVEPIEWIEESEDLNNFMAGESVYIYKRLPDNWLKYTLKTLRDLHK